MRRPPPGRVRPPHRTIADELLDRIRDAAQSGDEQAVANIGGECLVAGVDPDRVQRAIKAGEQLRALNGG